MVIRRITRCSDAPPATGQPGPGPKASPVPRRRIRAVSAAPEQGLRAFPDLPSEAEREDEEYRVGRGKPPLHCRFKKGKSGNPRGRPKGARNEKTLINEILGARVAVRTPEGKRRMNSYEISLMKLREKAAQGDLRAIREVLTYLGRISAEAEQTSRNDHVLTAADEMILDYLLGSTTETGSETEDGGPSNED